MDKASRYKSVLFKLNNYVATFGKVYQRFGGGGSSPLRIKK